MSAIEVRDVTKRFGDVTALDDLSLSVPEGSIFGLLGTNGAGKTTLFQLLVDHRRPDAGSVEVAGRPAASGPSIRECVGYLPQRVGFPPRFTGRETLSFHARMRGVLANERDTRITEVLDIVGLAAAADREIGGYSQGMVRRLGLATVLVGQPRVLLLDEPTSGLDPAGVEAFHDVIERYNADANATVVYTSHTLAEVETVCDRVAILHEGHLLADGTVDDLRRSAGNTVSVTLTMESAATVERAADRMRDADAVTSVSQKGAILRISCDRSGAFDVVSAARSVAPVVSFEVDEPDLADAFHRTLATAGESTEAGR